MEKRRESAISKIAIIGTEGAGKTVFVTVWSKLLERQEEGKPFIVPDPSTYAYIEKNWSKLRKGQWPESTPQSEFVHLFWRLKMPSGHLCQINVCDVAGHDIRRLFTGNKPQASDESTKAIYDTVVAANIVLVIINLKDFITTTESQRIDNCANLLSLLQYMFEQKKKVALVFSQWHEYEAWVAEHGSVEAVLSTYMPAVYNTCCMEDANDYFNVAAVMETTSSVEGGITITNPAANFSSSGLPRLNEWIMAIVDGRPSTQSSRTIEDDDKKIKHEGIKFGIIVCGVLFSLYMGFVFNWLGEIMYLCQNAQSASCVLGIIIGSVTSFFVYKKMMIDLQRSK